MFLKKKQTRFWDLRARFKALAGHFGPSDRILYIPGLIYPIFGPNREEEASPLQISFRPPAYNDHNFKFPVFTENNNPLPTEAHIFGCRRNAVI
jgi:hypothetical protein